MENFRDILFRLKLWTGSIFALCATVAANPIFLIIGGAFLVVVLVIFSIKSCGSPAPKLSEKEIQAAQQAVKTRNDAQLKEILIESDARVKAVDANISQAEARTEAATENNYRDLSVEQLAAEIEKRK